jgi:hypothetical protein
LAHKSAGQESPDKAILEATTMQTGLAIQTWRLAGAVEREPLGLMRLLDMMPVEMAGQELLLILPALGLFMRVVEAEEITPQELPVSL